MDITMSEQHHDVEPQPLVVAAASKRKFDEFQVVVDPQQQQQQQHLHHAAATVDAAAVAALADGTNNNNNNNNDNNNNNNRWYPTSIVIEARTFDGASVNADLMTVIGRGIKANKCTLSERFYLPSQYNQNNAEYRAKTIAPIFASACACAGCEVRLKGWEKSKGFLKFVCPQYRRYKSSKQQQQQQQTNQLQQQQQQQQQQEAAIPDNIEAMNGVVVEDAAATGSVVVVEPSEVVVGNNNNNKKGKIQRTISRPLDKESTCPFSFLVFWEEYAGQDGIPLDSRKGRWFVCATGAGTPYHEGHARKEFSEGELRRKQLQVEGAFDILMPFYKKVVDLVDRDEDKLNQAIGRLNGLIDGLKRQTIQQDPQGLQQYNAQQQQLASQQTRQQQQQRQQQHQSEVQYPSPELQPQVLQHPNPQQGIPQPPPHEPEEVEEDEDVVHHHHEMKMDTPVGDPTEHLDPTLGAPHHHHDDDHHHQEVVLPPSNCENSPGAEAANVLLEQPEATNALLDHHQQVVL